MPSASGLTVAEFAVGGDAVCASFERGGLAEMPGLAGLPSESVFVVWNGPGHVKYKRLSKSTLVRNMDCEWFSSATGYV